MHENSFKIWNFIHLLAEIPTFQRIIFHEK